MTTTTRAARLARAIHRTCLFLAPAAVRRVYRDEMIATFATAVDAVAAEGSAAIARLLAHELRDLLRARRVHRSDTRWAVPAEPSIHIRRPILRAGWLHGSLWRQAWRSLTRRPAYLAAAVLTLGFGTGVMTAVFSLVDTVLIKPLPYPDADQLVTVYESSPVARERTSLVAPGRLEDWQRLNRTFVALSASYSESVTDTSGDQPDRLEGRRVTARYFGVFAMPPLLGRTFTATEEAANGPGAAVISERFWTRRFNRDRTAIGRALTIGGRQYEIVGVMPAAFTGTTTDVWIPAQIAPGLMQVRDARFVGGFGRIRPGVTVEAAAQDLAAVQQALGREFPRTDAGWSVELLPLKQSRIGNARNGLVLVFAAVAALWLIAIANIAGLMIAEMQRRSRELAVRAALGASRLGAVAGVAREGLMIAVAGGVLGATLAVWLTSVMGSVLSGTPRIDELAMDWRALGFALVTSLTAAGVFSLVPALAATRTGVGDVLAAGGRASTGRRHRLQKFLVVAQVALSVVLVSSASLLMRSYYNLTRVDTGFDPAGVMTFRVAARWDEDRTRVGQLQTHLLERLEQLPHVTDAGLTSFLPASNATLRYQVRVEGLAGTNPDGTITVGSRTVTGGYLRAIRASLVAGAWCPEPQLDPPGLTAMVNRRFVETAAEGRQLVGRSLTLTQIPVGSITITGIVGDLAEDGPASAPVPYLYMCATARSWPDPNYVARTSDPGAFAADLRRIVRELDSTRAIFGLRPLQDVLTSSLDRPRLDASMLGLFAGAALLLAAIGIYSLFMLVVSEGVREIAVRLAIGAAPRQVMRLVLAGAGRLLAAGILIGIALTAAADGLLRGVLFGVSQFDPSALAATVLTIGLVSAIAVAGPAFTASRIAPIEVLRQT
jgi:putative ABC transport system permease protein